MEYSQEYLLSLPRRGIQAIAKLLGIKANQSTQKIIEDVLNISWSNSSFNQSTNQLNSTEDAELCSTECSSNKVEDVKSIDFHSIDIIKSNTAAINNATDLFVNDDEKLTKTADSIITENQELDHVISKTDIFIEQKDQIDSRINMVNQQNSFFDEKVHDQLNNQLIESLPQKSIYLSTTSRKAVKHRKYTSISTTPNSRQSVYLNKQTKAQVVKLQATVKKLQQIEKIESITRRDSLSNTPLTKVVMKRKKHRNNDIVNKIDLIADNVESKNLTTYNDNNITSNAFIDIGEKALAKLDNEMQVKVEDKNNTLEVSKLVKAKADLKILSKSNRKMSIPNFSLAHSKQFGRSKSIVDMIEKTSKKPLTVTVTLDSELEKLSQKKSSKLAVSNSSKILEDKISKISVKKLDKENFNNNISIRKITRAEKVSNYLSKNKSDRSDKIQSFRSRPINNI